MQEKEKPILQRNIKDLYADLIKELEKRGIDKKVQKTFEDMQDGLEEAIGKKKGMQFDEYIEEKFSKGLYPKYSAGMSKVADGAGEININDTLMMLNLVNIFIKSPYIKALSMITNITSMSYMLNSMRVPLEKKIGLELKPLEEKTLVTDTDDLVRELNALHSKVDYTKGKAHYNKIGNKALDDVMLDIEGITVPRPKIIKRSLMLEGMKHLGAGGVYFPSTHEVNIPSGDMTYFTGHAQVHENAHAAGYPRENEAQMWAYMACHRSGDPTLIYSTTATRLITNLGILAEMQDVEVGELLKDTNIPKDLRDEYGVNMGRKKTWFSKAFKKFNDVMLKARGQQEGVKAYTDTFTKMVYAYEGKS